MSFDDLFEMEIKKFLISRMNVFTNGDYDRIIVLDDGGKCISVLEQYIQDLLPIVGIEQTSSGYEAIRHLALPFPVLNVARSPVKLKLESPMIAQAAADRLFDILEMRNHVPKTALILGGGAIGQAMQSKLREYMSITVFDTKHSNIDNVVNLLPEFPLIIGCSGKTSIPHTLHSLLSPKTALVSVSSSDREFDAVFLRKRLPETYNCHEDLVIDDFLLMQSGFPINFDGERENIEPRLIQLTLALITAAILTANIIDSRKVKGLMPLPVDCEKQICNKFASEVPYSFLA